MSFFKNLFFNEAGPLIRLGRERVIQGSDHLVLPKQLDPESIPWQEDQMDWSSTKNFYKSYFKVSWPTSRKAIILQIVGSAFSFSTPLLMHAFISRLQAGDLSIVVIQQLLIIAFGFGLAAAGNGIAIQHYFYTTIGFFQTSTNMINKKIFSHALKLSTSARNRYQVGDIVNYMSSDSESVADACITIIDLVNAAILLIGCSAMLLYYMGWSGLVAIVVMAILIPMTQQLSKKFRVLQDESMSFRDQRITLMTQVLNAIRIIKYFVWEKSVIAEVDEVRKKEIATRYRLARAEVVWGLLYTSVSSIVLFTAFLTHALRGKPIDLALIFTVIAIFSLMEDHFGGMSRFIGRLMNISVSTNRLINFLKSETIEKKFLIDSSQAPALSVNNLSFSYLKNSELIKNLSFELKTGESLAVVGSVGLGKTTLLNLILTELKPMQGSITFCKSLNIGYVPQDAYIINGSLKENIIFGAKNKNEDDLSRSLNLSALEFDMLAWPSGLDTEIGEKGVNLSGGQKQRVSLARTILSDPDLILLDDPLSAVDPNTERFLIERLLFGHWKNKTRIVVTHRLAALKNFDHILFLREDGYDLGSFQELRSKSLEFENFLKISEHADESSNHQLKKKSDDHSVETEGDTSRLIQEEDRAIGAVEKTVYWNYIKALSGVPSGDFHRPMTFTQKMTFLGLFIAALSLVSMPLIQKIWLSQSTRITFLTPLNIILVYGALGLLTMLINFLSNMFWTYRGIQAGVAFHDRMLNSVLRTYIRFFDSTPIGRVLQRFSRDMESVDIYIQWSFDSTINAIFQVTMSIALIVITLPFVIFFLVPVLFLYYRFQNDYRRVAREVKRLDSLARSPRFAHFKETVQGLTVLRAFNRMDWVMDSFFQKLRYSNEMYYTHYVINRWFSVRLPLIGAGISMFTAFMVVYSISKNWIAAGIAGLVMQYANELWRHLNWGTRIFSDLESRMTSVERLNYYASLPPEENINLPKTAWPVTSKKGATLEFRHVFARYADHLPMVLKNVSFKIEAGSRAGLVGRTGSGKSTIFQTVYRFVDIIKGDILIDDQSIKEMHLEDLRKILAVIPQDPVLFMGSLRSNIDRYHQATDHEVWKILEKIEMADFIRSLPNQLEFHLAENGANLSQGQRQLICLARALLMKVKIIFMDEATASVDVETDALIQKVIRDSLDGITLVTIAHRLSTLEGYDQMIELHQGSVVLDEKQIVY